MTRNITVPDYLETCGSRIEGGLKQFLIDTFQSQVSALSSIQSENGLWHTVLTDPDSYEETSGSAAIITGIIKGIRLGYLDHLYSNAAQKGLDAICNNIDEHGTVLNVSAGTSMGMDAEHYKSIVIRPMAYGQSLVMLALIEELLSND